MTDKREGATKQELKANSSIGGIEFRGEIAKLEAEILRLRKQNQDLQRTGSSRPNQTEAKFTAQLDGFRKELSDPENLVSHAFKAISGLFYTYSVATNQLDFCVTGQEFAGYSKATFHERGGQLMQEILHPDDNKLYFGDFLNRLKVMRSGNIASEDFRIKHANGEWLWINAREIALEFTEEGKVKTYLGISQDVTEFRATKKELDDKQHFIDSIYTTVPSLIYVNDIVENRSIYANHDLARFLGYSVKEWTANQRLNLFHPHDSHLVEAMNEELVQASDGEIVSSELRLRHKDGHWKWLRFRDKVFKRDEDGRVRQIIGSASDITELKETVEKFRKSRLLYRSIARNMPNGYVLLFNKEMECVLAEGMLLRKLGYSPDDQSQFEGNRLPDGRSWILFQRQFKDALDGRKLSFEAQHQDNYFLVHLAPVYNDNGEVYAVMNITLDITALKRTQTELESQLGNLAATNTKLERYIASNLELEQFAYIASHDLKEPIRTIISFSQLLEMKFSHILDKDARDYMQYIVEGARRMQDLINGLLSYSRVETEGLPFERLDMNQVVDEVLSNLNRQIQERNVEVMYSELPDIMGDRIQVSQLIQNLISNGIKFNKSGQPEIAIQAIRNGDHWHFSVKDNGIGIAKQDYERIFGIFKRLHNREEYDGAGIGLSVCRRILERHGGSIWIDSVEEEGTTFHFSVPRRVEI